MLSLDHWFNKVVSVILLHEFTYFMMLPDKGIFCNLLLFTRYNGIQALLPGTLHYNVFQIIVLLEVKSKEKTQ